jgi:hypothetical protein
MLEKIAVSLPRLAASPSISPERATWITAQVNLFFGSFRRADADNPEVFTVGCARLFADYAPEIVAHVVDPLTGLPGKSEWLPSLRAVKAALDERHAELAQRDRLETAERQQLADRARDADRSNRPTFDDLRARHGQNWGLTTVEPDDTARNRALALVAAANARLLQRAGVEAGPGIAVSLALARSLQAKAKERNPC